MLECLFRASCLQHNNTVCPLCCCRVGQACLRYSPAVHRPPNITAAKRLMNQSLTCCQPVLSSRCHGYMHCGHAHICCRGGQACLRAEFVWCSSTLFWRGLCALCRTAHCTVCRDGQDSLGPTRILCWSYSFSTPVLHCYHTCAGTAKPAWDPAPLCAGAPLWAEGSSGGGRGEPSHCFQGKQAPAHAWHAI